MSGAERAVRRVVICSEQTLVAEAIESALWTRGFEPVRADEPAEVGLLVCELSTQQQVSRAQQVVAESALPWVVVAGTSRGPGWGAVLVAGAVTVLGSSVSLARIAGILDSVAEHTFVPDRRFEQDLRDEWAQVVVQVGPGDEAATAGGDGLLAVQPEVD